MSAITVNTLKKRKQAGEKITCLTAYDYSFASLLDAAGIDMIMVGDSLGMVMQGNDTTIPVSIQDMVYHTRCVARGCEHALIISDLSFMSYQASPEQALKSAGKVMKQGAQVAKLEGGEVMADTVRFLTERGVPVCAHIGLTPQSVHKLGGYSVQGRDDASAKQLLSDARSLDEAGASLIVLEAVPSALAAEVTRAIAIPTIGIGAGPDCDGQVLVLQDMLGIYPRPSPRFSRNFLEQGGSVSGAVTAYIEAVKSGAFPGPEHSFS
ncbi:MAG: 3-methyl-2-oxobutanoate hydroxymethyltransferase [Gammaproteobacteria bacterium]|nr:MAG: 3-methyl-2-oxobutanoate hydroxymethyltransferase [Gammaproteobacteria bacterium]